MIEILNFQLGNRSIFSLIMKKTLIEVIKRQDYLMGSFSVQRKRKLISVVLPFFDPTTA